MNFSVNLLFRGANKNAAIEPLWEERIVLIKANGEEEARKKGETLGKKDEESYETVKGDIVTWQFFQVERVHLIENSEFKNGTELFTRFLRDSEVKSLLTPFED